MEKEMEREFTHGLMGANTMENGKMEYNMEMECSLMQTDLIDQVHLVMARNMGHQFIQTQMEQKKDRFGDQELNMAQSKFDTISLSL